MSYRTILLHCNDATSLDRLLVPAMNVAEGFQAHLISAVGRSARRRHRGRGTQWTSDRGR